MTGCRIQDAHRQSVIACRVRGSHLPFVIIKGIVWCFLFVGLFEARQRLSCSWSQSARSLHGEAARCADRKQIKVSGNCTHTHTHTHTYTHTNTNMNCSGLRHEQNRLCSLSLRPHARSMMVSCLSDWMFVSPLDAEFSEKSWRWTTDTECVELPAHARLMYRSTVTIEDAVMAVSVMECSMQVRKQKTTQVCVFVCVCVCLNCVSN